MLRIIRYLILAVIVAVLVIVSMANRDMVVLTALPTGLAEVAAWNASVELPLFLVALGGVAVGLLVGFFLEWMRESKHRAEVAKRQKQVRALNREVTRLRGGPNDTSDEVLAILDQSAARKAS
jgi:putative membrane protein